MSNRRIVYKKDGTVAVIHPAPNSRREDETEMAWLERVFTKAMHHELEGCDYDDLDVSEIPTDRRYRDAWTGERGKGISIDPVKRAEIDARPTEEQEKLIQKKIRELAIAELKKEGKM